MDLVGIRVGPVHPVAVHIEGDADLDSKARGQSRDSGAIQVGSQVALADEGIGPVHHPAIQIEGDAGTGDSRHQIDQLAAIQVGALDLVGGGVGPVDVAGSQVQGHVAGLWKVAGQVLDVVAGEIDAVDLVGAHIGEVDPPPCRVDGDAEGILQAGDDLGDVAAV